MPVAHLIMAGVTTEVCVQTTMREANDRGYECLLAEDANASYFPAWNTIITSGIIRARSMSCSFLRQEQTQGVQARFAVENGSAGS
jgi:nicotinamidase-related amidase